MCQVNYQERLTLGARRARTASPAGIRNQGAPQFLPDRQRGNSRRNRIFKFKIRMWFLQLAASSFPGQRPHGCCAIPRQSPPRKGPKAVVTSPVDGDETYSLPRHRKMSKMTVDDLFRNARANAGLGGSNATQEKPQCENHTQ